MNAEEIEKVRNYAGDSVEEYWKPNPQQDRPYIDWFYYWEFREELAAGDLTHLRPLHPNSSITKNVVYQHERLRGYFYSAFVRFAVMIEHLQSLEDMFRNNPPTVIFPETPPLWKILSAFEGFYHFLGSVLDMLGGVGNIFYGFEGDEDSFTNFSNKIRALEPKTGCERELVGVFPDIDKVKAYRDRIVHRPAFAQWHIFKQREGNVGNLVGLDKDVLIEKDYLHRRAEGMRMGRKVLREMADGRIQPISIIDLTIEHKGQIEKLGNLLFGCFLERLPRYLDDNQIRVIKDRTIEIADLKNPPADAAYIFYLCPICEQRAPSLASYMQRVSEQSTECVNILTAMEFPYEPAKCGNPNMIPLFFIAE